jgi:hypothetical protein
MDAAFYPFQDDRNAMSTSVTIALLIGATIVGLAAWRWYVPYQQSVSMMTRGRAISPGSIRYKFVQFGRWFCVVFCAVVALFAADQLIGKIS